MELSEKIYKLRMDKGWTRSELARRINISKVQLGRYEEGTSQPTATVLASLAKELECTTDYLLLNNEMIGHVDKQYLDIVMNKFPELKLNEQLEILNFLKRYIPISS